MQAFGLSRLSNTADDGPAVAKRDEMRKALIALVMVGGCAQEPDPITISQGVYGVLSVSSDVGGQPDGIYPDAPVAAYLVDGTLVVSTTSDHRGAYELELQPGAYVICTLDAAPQTLVDQWLHNCAGKCTRLDVPLGIVQADWAANLSGGWWEVGEHCPR